ncbi:hypothetical protein [Metabacillus schmidteae]|uniref:hypothetical protein n=1 Tax=Metabacillus schmidteae TaxID=2730405 RepID=UPI00158DFFDB|nr:hypothetical protein [Metabacillus schmidteae]
MNNRLLIALLVSIGLFLSNIQVAMAGDQKDTDDTIRLFLEAWMKKDENKAQSYLMEGVKIPELKESTPIRRITGLPSPTKGIKVMVAFFDGELGGERIAFIWEVAVKNERITQIRVIHDGTNPFMEEAKVVKEYEMKFKKNILVPSKFPFEITGCNGYINNKELSVYYTNESINGFLKITIFPISVDLDKYKGKTDKYYTLDDGTRALYRGEFDLGYEMRFQKDGLQYTVVIGNKKELKKKFKAEDLIRIVESMHY